MSIWLWAGFVGLVLGFLALDLGVFHRRAHEVGMREALTWTAIWIAVSLLFSGVILYRWDWIQPQSSYTNSQAAMAFLAGYLVEWTLSVDNIFVFLVVFTYFRVPPQYQHRVLFWGIVGALVFRSIFIALGAVILSAFVWTMVIFGLFLIATGIKMIWAHGKTIDPGNNPVVRLFRRIMPTTDDYHGQRFFVRKNGALLATPLFVALLVVEFSDILFAVDSVPAIFAITQNPFIVFTSNVFAILGLRALFFAVAGLMQLFRFLHFGLAAVLMFVGVKMLYGYAQKVLVPDWPHFPIGLSLAIIVGVLASSILASVLLPVGPGNDDAPGTSSRPQQPKERELGR
ncbi:MAG: TerC family protein [Armatimonadetes bacterium]|nr:TerC family protein [Armatimonadota bacterium]